MTPNNAPITTGVLYRRLIAYSFRYWKLFLVAIVALLVAAATEPLMAYIMKPLIDESFSAVKTPFAQWLPAIILGLIVARGIGSFVNEYCSAKVAGMVVYDLRADMLARVLHLPNSFFVEEPSGKIISTVATNVESVTEAGLTVLTILIRDSAIVIGLLGVLLYTNWQLTLICFAMIPIIAFGFTFAAKKLSKYAHSAQYSHADLVQSISEVINAQKIIKIYGAQQIETDRFLDSAKKILRARVKLVATSSANSSLVQFVLGVALALVVYVASGMNQESNMTAGDFTSFMTAMGMLLNPLKQLSKINQQLQKGLAAADNVFKVIDREVEKSSGSHAVTRCEGKVVFDQVGLTYPGANTPTLTQIDLTVNPGQTVGIVGMSGGGKSTLINLLPRFLDVTSGKVTIDGTDVRDWNLGSLRRQIAVVTQESHLLNDTVRNNIAYGEMRSASEEQIREAAAMASALGFIEALDDGFDTILGDNGLRLSGGQRQRISIARAFLKNAPILILDEATSALDSQAEAEVQRDMERLRHGRTTLVIAHRLSTLVTADFIIVLDKGQIVEQGTHQQLLANKGHYRHLYDLQSVSQADNLQVTSSSSASDD